MTALPIKQCIMFLRRYYVIFLLKLRWNKLHTNLLFKLLLHNWDRKYNHDLIFNVSSDGFFTRSISLSFTKLPFSSGLSNVKDFRQKMRTFCNMDLMLKNYSSVQICFITVTLVGENGSVIYTTALLLHSYKWLALEKNKIEN